MTLKSARICPDFASKQHQNEQALFFPFWREILEIIFVFISQKIPYFWIIFENASRVIE
jgi:hypothetical protein